MSAQPRQLVRSLAIACAVATIALLAAVMDASAYYTAGGRTSARASVTTLAAPSISSATFSGAGTVSLSWSTVTAPASGTVSYYVSRDGGAPSAGCPSSAAPSSATSCTDTGVTPGLHQYTVTAVWRTWTRASAAAGVTVSYGAATQLVFTTQPGGGATGGVAFPTQPVVAAREANGNTVLDYAGTVGLSILRGGTAGATLSGCVGTLRSGVTTFSGCKIDLQGNAYALRAGDGTLTGDASPFNVSVGPAAQFLFTTQPGGGATGGSAFPTQPAVAAADAGGNAITSYTGTVTLSIVSGTGTSGATLSGCAGTLGRTGVTTFAGCKIDKVGSGYRLRASDTRITGDSAAFDVTPGAATRLAVTTQPAGATGGTAFTTQPVVTAQDAGGNAATSYAGAVTLSIVSGTGTSGATLSGCAGTLRGGVTTFAGCKIDKVGSGYVLRATDRTFTVDTAAFNVTAGAAARLLFTTQPAGAVAGTAFTTQPAITAYDAGGNVATGYLGTITLSIVSGTGTQGAQIAACGSTRTNGVTTFSGCKINRSGTGYVLRGSDGTLSVDSNPFNVS
jgi:hypothetical protein